jgi:hypothetical protein
MRFPIVLPQASAAFSPGWGRVADVVATATNRSVVVFDPTGQTPKRGTGL